MLPIDFSFEVLSPRAESVLSPDLNMDGLPPWITVSMHRRESEPARFTLPPEIAVELDDESRGLLDRMCVLYGVRMAPGERPDEDLHLQLGIQVTAQIAQASGGVVLDRLALRLLPADDFAGTCAPGTENHLTYTADADGVRSRGMVKFGFPELRIEAPGLEPDLCELAMDITDALCAGLTASFYMTGRPFELAGTQWRMDKTEDAVVARVLDGDVRDVLENLAAGREGSAADEHEQDDDDA